MAVESLEGGTGAVCIGFFLRWLRYCLTVSFVALRRKYGPRRRLKLKQRQSAMRMNMQKGRRR